MRGSKTKKKGFTDTLKKAVADEAISGVNKSLIDMFGVEMDIVDGVVKDVRLTTTAQQNLAQELVDVIIQELQDDYGVALNVEYRADGGVGITHLSFPKAYAGAGNVAEAKASPEPNSPTQKQDAPQAQDDNARPRMIPQDPKAAASAIDQAYRQGYEAASNDIFRMIRDQYGFHASWAPVGNKLELRSYINTFVEACKFFVKEYPGLCPKTDRLVCPVYWKYVGCVSEHLKRDD